MHRPIVIVDPLSAGTELAPAFKKRGLSCIAVTVSNKKHRGFGNQIQTSDFLDIIPNQPNLKDILQKLNPLAIIPGADSGVELAENLAALLTPQFANDPEKSLHRLHKGLMQDALLAAGIPSLKTINTSFEAEVESWIKQQDLVDSPLVVKPPTSAGSDNVFHIPPKGDWKKAFNTVLSEPSKITGNRNPSVIVQEQAVGIEFAVGTVTANGKHYLSHLIKYNKTSCAGRMTVFDHVEFVPYVEKLHKDLFDYTKLVLDAVGIRSGAAHTEIMLTQKGPRLIESGARMCGGPVVGFSRVATGSSQADKLAELFATGDIISSEYNFKKTVVPVFLKSPVSGTISNVEVFDEALKLPTFLNQFVWVKNGDLVPQTVDYLTSIGIIALAGDRELIFDDYQKVRAMELNLRFAGIFFAQIAQ